MMPSLKGQVVLYDFILLSTSIISLQILISLQDRIQSGLYGFVKANVKFVMVICTVSYLAIK